MSASDLILVRSAKAGDAAAMTQLITRHRHFALQIAGRYYIAGADRADVEQEALIAIMVAVRSFSEEAATPFRRFAGVCINRWLSTCVRASLRQKHQLLNDSLRESGALDDRPLTVSELAADHRADVEQLVLNREEVRRLCDRFASLTDLERRAIVGVANGESYAAIEGVPTGTTVKTIDNALQRARKKLASDPTGKELRMARAQCKSDGCELIPEQQFGLDAGYCARHARERRDTRRVRVASPMPAIPAAETLAETVKRLDKMAKAADRKRAKALELARKAGQAKREADAAEQEFRQLARELMGERAA